MSTQTLSLKEIKAPIAGELEEFEKHFRNSMKSQVPLLDKITYYIVQSKGKQLRPIFVFLTASVWGEIGQKSFNAASLIELLHTATLVHDDVVDDAHKRRGFFSINALWKNKIAVLVGDYLLSRGLLLALENRDYDILQIVSTAVKEMSEGELLQIEKARRLDIDEEVYFEIIRQKTASLIAAACAAGTASVTDDEGVIKKMRDFGERIGIAFQIKDDLFDYGTASIGKPKGIDIKEKKMTLPLIYALSNADKSQRKRIINKIKKRSTDPEVVSEVIEFVKSSGGLEYAESLMEDYKNKALAMLGSCPDSPARQALFKLVDFVISRNK